MCFYPGTIRTFGSPKKNLQNSNTHVGISMMIVMSDVGWDKTCSSNSDDGEDNN
jgi:hypothetical protein